MVSETIIISSVVFGIFLLIAAIVVWSTKLEKKRVEEMKRFSMQIGLTADNSDHSQILQDKFELFGQGMSKRIYNYLRGRYSGNDVVAFDYDYTIHTGKNTTIIRHTVVQIDVEDTPNFILKRENIFHKIGNLVGYKDIDFDRYPVFSKEYFLRGKDEPAIRNFFKPELLMFFETKKPVHTIECQNNKMLFYLANKRIKVEKYKEFLDNVKPLIEKFKKDDGF